jgi:hypothetical protein
VLVSRPGSIGRATLIDIADEFASSLIPVVQTIRATGALTLASMAIELHRRGIRSARGGKWHRSSVLICLIARSCRPEISF